MMVSLDTNAYSRLMQHQPAIIALVNDSEKVLISTVVPGELFTGFQIGTRYNQNVVELYQFLNVPNIEITPIDIDVAEQYGHIVSFLRKQGTPIPSNDIWIAAAAIVTG